MEKKKSFQFVAYLCVEGTVFAKNEEDAEKLVRDNNAGVCNDFDSRLRNVIEYQEITSVEDPIDIEGDEEDEEE